MPVTSLDVSWFASSVIKWVPTVRGLRLPYVRLGAFRAPLPLSETGAVKPVKPVTCICFLSLSLSLSLSMSTYGPDWGCRPGDGGYTRQAVGSMHSPPSSCSLAAMTNAVVLLESHGQWCTVQDMMSHHEVRAEPPDHTLEKKRHF